MCALGRPILLKYVLAWRSFGHINPIFYIAGFDQVNMRLKRSGAVAFFTLECTLCRHTWSWQTQGSSRKESTESNSQLTASVLFTGMLPSKVDRYGKKAFYQLPVPIKGLLDMNQCEPFICHQVHGGEQYLVSEQTPFLPQPEEEAHGRGPEAVELEAGREPCCSEGSRECNTRWGCPVSIGKMLQSPPMKPMRSIRNQR